MPDLSHNPVSKVIWVPINKVYANSYNPNAVATMELQLLYVSIKHDGFTMPIVTVRSEDYKIALPCGIVSLSEEKDNGAALWKFSRSQNQRSLLTPRARWMGTAASTSIDVQIVTHCTSINQAPMEEKAGVDGSVNSGGLEPFKAIGGNLPEPVQIDLATASCGIGTSRASTSANLYYIVFCPFCTSENKKPWKHWNTFLIEPEASTKAYGMILKCSSLEITGSQYPIAQSPNSSTVASTQSGQDGSVWGLFGVRDNSRFVVIIDGFHRYSIMKRYRDIYEKNHGLLPVVVIDKSLNDRMASTVRHNRARGKHSIQGMGDLVMQMLGNGWRDARICAELGLEKEELARLKHITGYAKLYKDAEYSRSLESPRQIEARLKESERL